MKLKVLVLPIIATLAACGQSNPHRHFEKQRTSSDIKISFLNLETYQIQMRFEYRSYTQRTLESIDCKASFNNNSSANISKDFHIELGAFSTEMLDMENVEISNRNPLLNLSSIEYTIKCNVKYDSGSEYITESSILHLIPGSKLSYR